MKTDTSERGLERLICIALTGSACDATPAGEVAAAEPASSYGGAGYIGGHPADYDREYCVDLVQLAAFLRTTQPELIEALDFAGNLSISSPATARRSLIWNGFRASSRASTINSETSSGTTPTAFAA